MVIERIEHRVAALRQPDDPREAAKQVLAELLPLDPERQAENEVWLAFTARALVDPQLRALRDEAYDLLRDACQRWVRLLLPRGASELDINLETERLFALLDGLAVHAAMRPERTNPEVLNHHLDQISAADDPQSQRCLSERLTQRHEGSGART
jgi:hypothetical protein